MHHQRYHCQLPHDVHYLNGAYMSPLMAIMVSAHVYNTQKDTDALVDALNAMRP